MEHQEQTQNIDLSKLSADQLEEALKERRSAEKAIYDKNRTEYLEQKDSTVLDLISQANEIHEKVKAFKSDLHVLFELHAEKLANYSMITKQSKGGFSLVHTSQNFKVTRTRSLKPNWDERSHKALELIKDFLEDVVKKIDPNLFEILIDFIQKNKEGDLEYSKVMMLISHKDKFEDKRWNSGLNLLVESYSNSFRGYGYVFYTKDEQQQWSPIDINFSSI